MDGCGADTLKFEYTDDEVNRIWEMEFESLESASNWYNEHALLKGFSIRQHKNYTSRKTAVPLSKVVVCSAEGFRRSLDKTGSFLLRQPSDISRHGCMARIKFKYDRMCSKYAVTNFISSHSHPPTPLGLRHLGRSHRLMTDNDITQVKAMRAFGVKGSLMMDMLAMQSGGYAGLRFTKKDLANMIDKCRRVTLRDGDSETAICYLEGKSRNDSGHFYGFDWDDEHRLTNLFWADAKSRADFMKYCDLLLFDSTFNTNKFRKALVTLMGVNNHFQTIVFGVSLLVDESADSYFWLLTVFKECMLGREPRCVITDGDKAMHKAVALVFPNAVHRSCSFHLHRNVNTYVKQKGFVEGFRWLQYSNCTPQVFEVRWADLVKQHKLENSVYVKGLYAMRHKWAAAYLTTDFFGMTTSTGRCEAMNNILKCVLTKQIPVIDVVMGIERVLGWIRVKENENYFKASQLTSPLVFTGLVELEQHAASVYTRSIFIKVLEEMKRETLYASNVCRCSLDGAFTEYIVHSIRNVNKHYSVWHSHADDSVLCSCKKLDRDGIVCAHIIYTLKALGKNKIPSNQILGRWTKAFASSVVEMTSVDPKMEYLMRKASLAAIEGVLNLSAASPHCYEEARAKLILLTAVFEARNKAAGEGRHVEVPEEEFAAEARSAKVMDPKIVRPKGRPKGSKKKPRCSKCGLVGHKSTTCKKIIPPVAPEDEGDNDEGCEENHEDVDHARKKFEAEDEAYMHSDDEGAPW